MSEQDAAGEPELDAAAIVAALNRHQVRYVIIGAFAAIAQQAPIPATRDIDLTPEASQENLARLSSALKELDARIRTEAVPDGLPFSHDATSLAAAEVWNLTCPDGEFDISFHPSRAEAELLGETSGLREQFPLLVLGFRHRSAFHRGCLTRIEPAATGHSRSRPSVNGFTGGSSGTRIISLLPRSRLKSATSLVWSRAHAPSRPSCAAGPPRSVPLPV